MRGYSIIAGLCLSLFSASLASAATPEVVHRAEKATALVRVLTNGKPSAYGSAFCFDDIGLFITNAHVADGKSDVDLVLDPGEKTQRIIPAKVLRSDATLDLAVLQAEGDRPFTALGLGKIDGLVETQDIIAFGYPFGAAMSLDSQGFPSVSVNTGHITSLRKKDGELTLIQVDAALNPGNSGGPVVDSDGNVIGIVEAGIVGSGVNFAIPISRLDKLLKDPLLAIAATTLSYDKRSDPQAITVKVISRDAAAPEYAVQLTLKSGDGDPRVLSGQTKGGAFAFNTSLLPAPAETVSPLELVGKFADGAIIGRAVNRAMQVGTDKVMLADIRGIDPNPDGTFTVSTADRKLTGAVPDLAGLSVSVGGVIVTPVWAKARTIAVTTADSSPHSVDYTLIFTRLTGTTLDPNDTYDSGWIGIPGGGGLNRIDTAGGVAVGISGKKADKLGTLALVVLSPSGDVQAPATPAPNHHWRPSPPVADSGGGPAAPPLPPAGAATDRPPAQGQAYTSFEQMFATLPPELQPKGRTWYITARTNPELNHRVGGQQAVMTAGFAEVKDAQGDQKGIEVSLDAGEISYRGFKFGGTIKANFPADKADFFKKLRIGDQVTITGTIKEAVLRGGNMTEAYLWLNDCTVK